MAWLEKKGQRFLLVFRLNGSRYKKLLDLTDRREAEAITAKVERRLEMLERGEWQLPDPSHVADSLIGELAPRPVVPLPQGKTLGALIDEYIPSVSTGCLESNTVATLTIHLNHVRQVMGRTLRVESITFAALQKYVDTRSKARGIRGKPLSAATLRKELVSWGAMWTWATRMGYVKHAFPKQGLRYPKVDEKPAFQTFAEIERRVARGNLTPSQQADLWDCLFFAPEELTDVLEHVRLHARHTFIYPMVLTAAHTGARRSELIRMEVQDIDLEAGMLTIREKKRVKGTRSSRSVPLSAPLKQVLAAWLPQVTGRLAFQVDGAELTCDEVIHHIKWTLADSPWKNVRGWHVFRHSFISNCASCGIDQRMIDDWVGHQTDDMRKRYRHLLPSTQRAAMDTVFGR